MIDMRGRNGTVRYRSHRVTVKKGAVAVEFFAPKRGRHAPVIFWGEKEEIKDLFRKVLEEIENAE